MNCPNCNAELPNHKKGTKEEKKIWAFRLAQLMNWDEHIAHTLWVGSSMKQAQLKELVETIEKSKN